MRRILVPLDGSDLAASILPDALRLAGKGGTLILVRDAAHEMYDPAVGERSRRFALEQAQSYLQGQATELRKNGAHVEAHVLCMLNPATAIARAAQCFNADMMAVSTHGYGPIGRLIHNSIAWRAMAHSPVPVLVRHAEDERPPASVLGQSRCVMVPLDGSIYAENALPLSQQLAAEWHASIWLVRCVPSVLIPETLPGYPDESYPPDKREDMRDAREYLDRLAETLSGEVHTGVYYGQVGPTLALFSRQLHITDVVMASHGRTGLSRVILGSVADELIGQMHCPIVVIPALASRSMETKDRSSDHALAMAGGSTQQA